jgi:hypothetical protein
VSALPALLGGQLGAGLGGQSTLGRILGGIGGSAVGLGVGFGSAVFGAGGGLAAAGLAALGPAALIGAPLLVGAILLGRAAQRRKDEAASGEFLTQALQGIEQLATAIATDQIEGAQARAFFDSQILGPFKQQISGLKTKSVVESRLKNQVNDLNNVYRDRIEPLIAEQQKRRADAARFAGIDARIVPEFATGGTSFGGLALLHPGEKILNRQQQISVISQSNPQVFERAGVPGPGSNRIFDVGGTMSSGSAEPTIVIEELVIDAIVDAEGITIKGLSGPKGRKITVKNIKEATLNREL